MATINPEPAERRRVNSRAALAEAAYEEFTANGYEATTVSGIAARAGVTTGAVYAHFSGKLELLFETVGLAPVDDLMRAFSDLTALPGRAAIERLSAEMATEPDRRTVLLLDVIVAARRNPAIARILSEGLRNYLVAGETVLRTGTAAGRIDPAISADDLTRVLGLMNLGSIIFAALGEPGPTPAAFARLVDLLLQASDGPDGGPQELATVRAKTRTAQRAKEAQVEAMAAAARAGVSLRQIGAAAEMSHEHVRQLLRNPAG